MASGRYSATACLACSRATGLRSEDSTSTNISISGAERTGTSWTGTTEREHVLYNTVLIVYTVTLYRNCVRKLVFCRVSLKFSVAASVTLYSISVIARVY